MIQSKRFLKRYLEWWQSVQISYWAWIKGFLTKDFQIGNKRDQSFPHSIKRIYQRQSDLHPMDKFSLNLIRDWNQLFIKALISSKYPIILLLQWQIQLSHQILEGLLLLSPLCRNTTWITTKTSNIMQQLDSRIRDS